MTESYDLAEQLSIVAMPSRIQISCGVSTRDPSIYVNNTMMNNGSSAQFPRGGSFKVIQWHNMMPNENIIMSEFGVAAIHVFVYNESVTRMLWCTQCLQAK